MTTKQRARNWRRTLALLGGASVIVWAINALNFCCPGWWDAVLGIQSGFAALLGAIIGFAALAMVFYVTRSHDRQLAEQRRQNIIRALAEEVAGRWAAVATCIEICGTEADKISGVTLAAPPLDKIGRAQLRAYVMSGRIFEATDTADLGLLGPNQVRTLIRFHHMADTAIAAIDVVENYEVLLASLENVKETAIDAARAFASDHNFKF